MNPNKRDYNGWILCPSTRFPGKFYYFNVVTGEAAWSLSNVERRMVSRPSFPQSDKWQTYPEPESPPEETSQLWNYQPEPRMYHQPMPVFGQPAFPNYGPSMVEPMSPNIGWTPVQIPTSIYRPMNVQTFDPSPQSWPNFGQHKFMYRDPMKRDFQEHKYFDSNNRYFDVNNKFPNFNSQRQVFSQKPMNYPVHPGPFMHPKDMFNAKGTMPYPDQRNTFKPHFRAPNEQFNENMFSQNSLAAQELNRQRILNQKFISNSQTFGHSLSKSQENLAMFNSYNNFNTIQKPDAARPKIGLGLLRSKSMSDLKQAPKHDNPFLSPKKNIPFPHLANQNFSTSKSFDNLLNVHSTTEPAFSPEKKVQKVSRQNVSFRPAALKNRLVFVDNKGTNEKDSQDSEQNLSETDLRYVLMARRRKSSLSEHEDGHNEVKKIKTTYSEEYMQPQPAKKKRVTFNLGVEDDREISVAEDCQNHMDIVDTTEDNCEAETDTAPEEQVPVCVIADADVLLAEFELIDEFVQSDETYTLLVPQSVKTEVEALGQGLCNGRHLVLSARHIVRKLADPPTHITVEPRDSSFKCEELTKNPILKCCLQMYDDGNYVILVTDNEELYKNATELELECYTSQQIKEYMATPKTEVSFDLKKVENGGYKLKENLGKIPFALTKDDNEVTFSKKEKIQQNLAKKIDFEEDDAFDIQSKTINQSNDNSFFHENDTIIATQISNDIENLNLKEIDEKIDSRKPKGKQLNKEKEIPSSYFKNDSSENVNFQNGGLSSFSDRPQAADSGVASKKKIKDINVYNLSEHLRSFYVRNNVVEERIATRMDEWLCLFVQIMEATLLDALSIIKSPQIEDCTNFPLRDLLQRTRDVYADHRTVRVLIDKLCAALDYGFKNAGKNNCPTFSMKPNEFMQMFGFGVLLIKSLKNILQENPALSDGEELLENLHRDVLEGRPEPEGAPPPPAPPAARDLCPRPDFVKKPSEILQYLREHYPEWNSYRTPEDNPEEAPPVQPKSTKIARTFGKHLGLLKFDSSKNMTLAKHNQKDTKHLKEHNNDTLNANKEFENSELFKEELTGPKMIKKLALHPFLPPKMKEIDVEKRETINNELINMIETMTDKKPAKCVTKYYDLNTIIVNKNADNNPKSDPCVKNLKDFQKSLEALAKILPHNSDDAKRNKDSNTAKNVQKTSKDTEVELEDKLSTKTDVNLKQSLDLDMLDYSDIQSTPDTISERTLVIDTSFEATSPNDKEVEETIFNDRQKENFDNADENTENDERNHDDEENNDVAKDDDAQQNDASNVNDETNAEAALNGINHDSNEVTDDSGIESESQHAYSFCQNFLCELSCTYKTVYYFIKSSLSELKHKNNIRSGRKKFLHENAASTYTIMATIIRNLKFIIERETNDGTKVIQLMFKEGTEPCKDKRISRYRQVIVKCLEQARILQNALKLLQRATGDEDVDSVSCSSMTPNEYYNVFE
ncbi:uncharacterized protein LOC126379107 [Pectinophora gossypiella]|uniref:uncharacterized protein LOC126379107 n=1 Tax=Pectinophora gossypiella TaxID=13191 RepID=UPI00214F51F4|nr:uncharacterized protein LOC126379107 [Pectinophora gossypiella]